MIPWDSETLKTYIAAASYLVTVMWPPKKNKNTMYMPDTSIAEKARPHVQRFPATQIQPR